MENMTSDEILQDQGYDPPFDESPFPLPDGWKGGAVENLGGNVYCRVWTTWEGSERRGDKEYEVIYNVPQDREVALQEYTWNEERVGYEFEEVVESRTAETQTDSAQASVARSLMNDFNSGGIP